MNNILEDYKTLADAIENIEDFRIYDFIYYLGINSVNKDLSKEEIEKLINICKESSDDFIDTFKLARTLTSIVYKDRYMTLEQLERVPSESIKHFYLEEQIYEMRYYFESDEEIVTPLNEIMKGVSYTIARVVHNGYCVELHYCSDTGATIEYGTKTSHDSWENEIEEINWFNKDLTDDYILNRLNCLYDEQFSDKRISDDKAKELNLIDHILSKHKVDDIELYINDNGDLLAFDDSNYWKNKEFYDFMFNELFVYNHEGKVELILEEDYKTLEKFRDNYSDKTIEKDDIELERNL